MSDPISNDEISGHHDSPKPSAAQLRGATPPSSLRARGHDDQRSSSYRGSLENEVRRQMYRPEAIPQPQRKSFSALTFLSWLAIVAACTAVLIMVIAASTKSFWQGVGAHRDATSEAPQPSSPA